jgi:drug/metabolite transporter (DMT)-like permease
MSALPRHQAIVDKLPRLQLGQMLVTRHLISQKQLEDALEHQRENGQRALLGETLKLSGMIAVLVATFGVVLTAWKPGAAREGGGGRAAAFGIAAGGLFGFAAVAFRGAITGLDDASFVMRATTVLAWSLGMQSVLLLAWMGLFDRGALTRSFGAWRGSIFAGFMGAFASQFWFIGFALTSAAATSPNRPRAMR